MAYHQYSYSATVASQQLQQLPSCNVGNRQYRYCTAATSCQGKEAAAMVATGQR